MAAADIVGEPHVNGHELPTALWRRIDLCQGHPTGHVLGQTRVALRLVERAPLDAGARREVFHTSMLSWVGCHFDSFERGIRGPLDSGHRRSSATGRAPRNSWTQQRQTSSASG
ncbi:hypothetical protein GCM10017608_10370 [Agromyces luteolus]|uniref:Uncharacterized protein n=1 Tax=Agromyces luteolus TaxID=88373 RepID=A0A7C9HSP2_9MICO|nr:hypothetical protein [Agromyces luteolus]MUN08569.1 hypothetical protein [Agromyces luteolus]GLK27104.1 hypothetical protein GCM10017608_10370 [Agromyces luteolus]